ncbi:hypothetical protein BGLY_2201 [Bacillus glycinifermentans]|nr:hypothetical protein BGLY_2201 [Bacillus glycinifermentans]
MYTKVNCRCRIKICELVFRRHYVTERLDSPGFEGRDAEFTVLSLKSVLNLT